MSEVLHIDFPVLWSETNFAKKNDKQNPPTIYFTNIIQRQD